jgi:uncharacterized protein (DUF885 family)
MLAAALVALLVAAPLRPAERSIDDFLQSFTDQWMLHNTDTAANRRYFQGAAQDAMERLIAPRTAAQREKGSRMIREAERHLRSFDRTKMTAEQRLSGEIVAWDLRNRIEGERYVDYNFPLVQTYGAAASLVQLMTVNHTVATRRDAENYVVRMAQLAPRMEEVIIESQRILKKGLIPPKFILEASLAQIRAFLADPPDRNALVAGFAERMKRVVGLDAAKQRQLLAEAERITSEHVHPAWKKAQVLIETTLPKATDDAGLWRFKDGAKVYAHRLRQYTTTNMTADQIHETGLRMVAEIEAKMDTVLRQSGLSEGTVTARAQQFWSRQPRYEGSSALAERQADIDAVIRDAERRAALLFEHVPRSRVVAQPYPAFMGQRAASYSTPPADGSRPGIFQYTASADGPKGRRSTIYHETIPGHHFQLALQVENTALPRFRKETIWGSNSAFAEGWGLYAERLAAESGWYEGDTAGALDQLEQEIFRARRLVVDTGLHAKRWTRQQAIDYLQQGNVSEVERYVVQPGQACSYMIGQLKLIELRERARRELGPRFSLKQYHNLVLGTGMVPLDILEQQVDQWIRSQKS